MTNHIEDEVNNYDDIRITIEVNGEQYFDMSMLCNTQERYMTLVDMLAKFNLKQMSRFGCNKRDREEG